MTIDKAEADQEVPYLVLYRDKASRNQDAVVKVLENVGAFELKEPFDNAVKIIHASGEFSYIVYTGHGLSGERLLLQGSQWGLPSTFCKRVCSVEIVEKPICAVLFEKSEFDGRSIKYCQNVERVGSAWDNIFSSVIIENCGGCSVTIFKHEHYRGRSKTFRGCVSNFGY
jgi:hypothetical protein